MGTLQQLRFHGTEMEARPDNYNKLNKDKKHSETQA
jgi:hypothetical protein